MTNAPKITARPVVAYSRGRGGVLWPEGRYAACVDGKTLNNKKGLERKFKTKEAAIKAAEVYLAKASHESTA